MKAFINSLLCAHCHEQGYTPPNKFLALNNPTFLPKKDAAKIKQNQLLSAQEKAGRHLILHMSAQRKVRHAGGAKLVFLIMHGLTFSI